MTSIPNHTRRWTTELPANQWDRELHPDWCADTYGCGLHSSNGHTVTATTEPNTAGDCPDIITAAIMDAAGQTGVSLAIEAPTYYEAVYLTPDEARRIGRNLIAEADLADTPTTRTARPSPSLASVR